MFDVFKHNIFLCEKQYKGSEKDLLDLVDMALKIKLNF